MSLCVPLTYPHPFDPVKRHHMVAAMLSGLGNEQGIIEPPDGVRWSSRDMAELEGRNYARQHKLRPDRLWTFKLTFTGRQIAESLR